MEVGLPADNLVLGYGAGDPVAVPRVEVAVTGAGAIAAVQGVEALMRHLTPATLRAP